MFLNYFFSAAFWQCTPSTKLCHLQVFDIKMASKIYEWTFNQLEKVLKIAILDRLWSFLPQKVCKSAITHRTPEKVPHARTSHAGGSFLTVFQYLIFMIWRPCDLNLVMISSLASKCQDFKLRGLQFHFIKQLKNYHSNFKDLLFWSQ